MKLRPKPRLPPSRSSRHQHALAATVCSSSSTPASSGPLPRGSSSSSLDVWDVALSLQQEFHAEDLRTAEHQRRVLRAFRMCRVGSHHVQSTSSGYGIGDVGRSVLDEVFREVWECEAAVVRANIVSGTHAIACGLYGVLRPGSVLLSCSGSPYDTLEEVVGGKGSCDAGTLVDWGVRYETVGLKEDGTLDWEAIEASLESKKPSVCFLQRSCGYKFRPTYSLGEIKDFVDLVRRKAPPGCLVLVDNCYGEFVEEREPVSPEIGADLMMGSLIKSPGGTIAPCGGYVAGRGDLVAKAVARLTVPGAGSDNGAHLGDTNRLLLQGLYMAPHAVGEGLKGSRLIAHVMDRLGYEVLPPRRAERRDFVTAVKLRSEEELLSFCKAVQEASPVNSFVNPVPGDTPGYADQVVFADGTFVAGSTGEMTCDGPLREPYAVFCQGGTHWTQWGIALENVLEKLNAGSSSSSSRP
ncbi:methionine gamma-lyase [Chloropicon primus]|uniref:Methionine gamma-lyase n=2 Tax=Chloropicon primus TaxID=1764295 RepID=A0A5B8MZ64_9CHLO|nr:methionine gamma-lyase [Chloropicon primus]UPR03909.1 methionine gamma-lyase [Chloropicon primus]|eukprot:QDZ24704.1 methionine gamma-lyase [Chloropicon primus]